MFTTASIINTLAERREQIVSRFNTGFGNSADEIRGVIRAIDHPASYYVSLGAAAREAVRQDWLTLAAGLGVRPAKPKKTVRPARPPAAVAEPASDALFSPAWLPHKPYCSNDKTASRIRPVEQALEYAYIQPNPPGLLRWIVLDIDRPDARARFDDVKAPMPNIVVLNPTSGRAHYFYALATPVCMTECGHEKPKRYARAIHDALAALLGADLGYSGLMAKNPLHPSHYSLFLRKEPYSLAELAEGCQSAFKFDHPSASNFDQGFKLISCAV